MQLQGSPVDLPAYPPRKELALLILEDFTQNYRRFEHWQSQRRMDSCRAKLLSTTKGLFAVTRPPAKPPLDSLVDHHGQSITVLDTRSNVVSVPAPFPTGDATHWTLQSLNLTLMTLVVSRFRPTMSLPQDRSWHATSISMTSQKSTIDSLTCGLPDGINIPTLPSLCGTRSAALRKNIFLDVP